jgi:cell division protein FtsQ
MLNQQMKTNTKSNKSKNILFWLKSILIFVLLAVTFVLVALSPLFNINSIEVSGNKHYENQDIIDATDIITGSNGFKTIGDSLFDVLTLRYGNAEKQILENRPYVKNVKVKYLPPTKVRIELVERSPIALVPYFGTGLIIDDEGYILDTETDADSSDLIVIKGLKIEDFELGQPIKADNLQCLAQAFSVIKAVNESDSDDDFKIGGLIESIDASDGSKVCLFVDSRIVVNLGNLKDLEYRIRLLKQLLLKNIKQDDRGLLDFTTGENVIFIPDMEVSNN